MKSGERFRMKLSTIRIACLATVLVTVTAACGSGRWTIGEVTWVEYDRFADDEADTTSLLAGPVDITVMNDLVWVLDSRADDVALFTSAGELVRRVGRTGEGPGEFSRPALLLTWPDTVGVWDFGSNRIQRFGPRGEYGSMFRPGTAEQPAGGAGLDPEGRIFLARGGFQFDHLVQVLAPDGSPRSSFGDLPAPRVDMLDMVAIKTDIVEGRMPPWFANSIMVTVTDRAAWVAFQAEPVVRRYSLAGELEQELALEHLDALWETRIAAWRQRNAEDDTPYSFYGLRIVEDIDPLDDGGVLLTLDDPERFSAIRLTAEGRIAEEWTGPAGEWRKVAVADDNTLYAIDQATSTVAKLVRSGG